MQHLEDGRLHELLDGELDPVEVREIEAHLHECLECARRLKEARTFLTEADGLIRKLDPPVPSSLPRPAPGVASPAPATPFRMGRYRQLAWAASIVLATGLGFSASEFWHRSHTPLAVPRDSIDGEMAKDRSATPLAEGAVNAQKFPAESGSPGPRQTARESKTAPRAMESLDRPEPSPTGNRRAEPSLEAAKDRPADALRTSSDAREVVPDKAEERGDEEADQESVSRLPQAPPASALAPAASPLSTPPAAGLAANEESQALARSKAQAQPLAAGRSTAIRPKPVGLVEGLSQRLQPPAPGFRRIVLEEAVRQLSGAIRLIDGAAPEQVQFGPGAGPADFVVRVVYADPPSREIWLDQQRISGQLTGLGDTTVVALTGGGVRLSWQDASGFRLALTGNLTADSLKSLAHRVR